MFSLIAIDPGTERSGFVILDGENVIESGIENNPVLLGKLKEWDRNPVVIEMVSSYGMPVGRETFEAVVWIGRFLQAGDGRSSRLFRKDVKLHFCHSARAKDPHIWQAIVDRYGGKEKAVGSKRTLPGPLYGIKSHSRAALAVGLAWLDGVRSDGL